ncbi:hypothetical protein TNCV_2402641 [Trichonephila clavipes]|nr:hypothetical protein TNCV_2402641 [Trichonephila clavipes]
MGVISAIGGYNFGCFNSLAIEHNELSSVSVDISHKRDKRRLAQSEKKNSSDWRKKRIINKLTKSSKITKNIKKEGETYGAVLSLLQMKLSHNLGMITNASNVNCSENVKHTIQSPPWNLGYWNSNPILNQHHDFRNLHQKPTYLQFNVGTV